MSLQTEKVFIADVKRVSKLYVEKFPNKGILTRNFYRKYKNPKLTMQQCELLWGDFISLRNIALKKEIEKIKVEQDKKIEFENNEKEKKKATKKKKITRETFDVPLDHKKLGGNRVYVVTCAIAGADLDKAFTASILNYCKIRNAQLVILPMRGILTKYDSFSDELLEYSDKFVTEIDFNLNISAQDFILNPQQILPLTGLTRYGQKGKSLIVASPKQQMVTVPVANASKPHIMLTTGSITTPRYRKTRQGKIAEQDHVKGALILEIEDDTIFHVRHIQADDKDGFYDLDKYYCGNKVTKTNAEAFIMGDYHTGFQDLTAVKVWQECLNVVKPKYLIWHDLFESKSISHWIENDMNAKVNRPEFGKTLEIELNNIGHELVKWRKQFPNIEFVIVRSNHDEHLDRYLTEGRYVNDTVNHVLALELALNLIRDHKNPLQEYIETNFKIKNLIWLKRDEDFKIAGIQLGSHGDRGQNGAKGNVRGMELSYGNSITGHGHSPMVLRGAWVVGTSTNLRLDYTVGPSSWLHCSGIVYKSGQRQLIISVDGKWKI